MIKKLLTYAVTAIAACTMLCPSVCAETETIVTKTDVPQKIVFIGDSIAAGYGLDGYGADNGPEECYAQILSSQYHTDLADICDNEMCNVAVSGDTSEQLLNHLENGEFDAALDESDAIVISIGGNDILGIFLNYLSSHVNFSQTGGKTSINASATDIFNMLSDYSGMEADIDTALEEFDQKLISITDYIKSKTDGRIIVQTLYNPMENLGNGFSFLENLAEEKISALDEKIRNIAATDTIELYSVCDLYPDFVGKAHALTNIDKWDIHPNADGHKVIAQKLDKTIRETSYECTQLVEVKEEAQAQTQAKNSSSDNTSKSSLYVVLGLFFGGFIMLFAAVIIAHKIKK